MPDPTKQKQAPGAQSSGASVNTLPEPTWSLDDYDHPTDAPDRVAETHQAHPVSKWWDRLRAIPRGIVGAANETAQTVFEGAAALDRKTGLGEAIQPGYNAAYDDGGAKGIVGDAGVVKKENVEKVLGRRSDDGIANFIESATQFATSYAATGGVTVGGVKLAAMGARAALARGAITDLTAFDPYESQLAELAARSPVPGLKEIGQALSVTQDDGPIVARLKRATAGVMTGAAVDGIVARARIFRAKKALASGKLSAEAATSEIEKNANVLNDIAEGTHKSPDDALHVERFEDNWTIKPNPDHPLVEGFEPTSKSPLFSDRATAEATAASGNAAIAEHTIALKSKPQVAEFTQKLTDMFHANDVDGLRAMMEDSDHFNVSYYTQPKEALAAIESTSQAWKGAIDAAQARGAKNIPEMIDQARAVLGSLDEESATKFFGSKLRAQKGQEYLNLAADQYMRILGKKVADIAVRYEASNGGDPIILKEAQKAVSNLFEIQKSVAQANSTWGKTGRLMQERGSELLADAKLADPAAVAKVKDAGSDAITASADETAKKVAGMDTRSIEKILRAARIADGNVKNIWEVGHLAKTELHPGKVDKFMEVFANNLLTKPVTAITQLTSGVSVAAFESTGRMLAGVAERDPAMIREGADQLFAHYHYFQDNLGSAWAALKAGRSVLNPQTQHVAFDGKWGKFVPRGPSTLIGGVDEFIKASNYRAMIRAKSLRLGRAKDLVGDDLERYVANDIESAFSEHGVALVTDALKFGETAAMSAPLEGSFGRAYQNLANTNTLVRIITPFIKAPINMFNYAWQHTPGLNMFNAQARKIMEAGGEEAATLHAKTALAGSFMGYGAIKALQGDLTGSGPKDPTLAAEWRANNNQPYSVRVGGKWVSYKRTDPFGLPMSLIADAVQYAQEGGAEGNAHHSIAAALVSSLASSLTSKTYLQGLTNAVKSMGDSDPNATQRWLNSMAVSSVPGLPLAGALNTDPHLREVRGMLDALMSNTPGLSERLDPRFSLFGEPLLRNGVAQRAFNPFQVTDVSHTVNERLMEIGKGFPVPPSVDPQTQIDFSDRKWDTKGVGKSPYARWMEIVKQGPLKQNVETMLSNPAFKELSNGSDDWRGGAQFDRMQGIINGAHDRARRQMLSEYPALANQITATLRAKGASIRGGQSAVDKVREMFGVKK